MDDLIDETTEDTTDDWTERQDYTPAPSGAGNEPAEPRYLGLTGSQFNLAFFAVLGVIALAAFLFLGGASAVQDLVGGDDPAPRADVTRPAPADDTSAAGGDGEAVSAVLDTFNPFALMGTLGSQPGAPSPGDDGNDGLKAALLDEGDLPAGFSSFGEMSFSVPVEGSTGTMAANMFSSGDLASGEFGAMVMSAALEGPPGALDQLGNFEQLAGASEEELAKAEDALGQLGVTFSDFGLLDASGLGDGGMGMRMAMDFGGMFDQFGLPASEAPPFDAIALEMYAFARGERMYMVMVMWPDDADPGLDSRSLADAVNAKAG